jgi:hypothetical protein
VAEESVELAPSRTGGVRIDGEAQQQWRDFVERFLARLKPPGSSLTIRASRHPAMPD